MRGNRGHGHAGQGGHHGREILLPYDEGVVVTSVGDDMVVLSGTPTVQVPGVPAQVMTVLCATGWGGFVAAHLDAVRLVGARLVHGDDEVGGYASVHNGRRLATLSTTQENGHPITLALNAVHEAGHHFVPWHRDALASEVVAQEAAVLAWQDSSELGIAPDAEFWAYGWQVDAVRCRGGFLYAPLIRAAQRQHCGGPACTTGNASHKDTVNMAPTADTATSTTRRSR